MTLTDSGETEKYEMGYLEGSPFLLAVELVECDFWMAKTVAARVREAISAGREHGMSISISSAFRTMDKQTELYKKFKEGTGNPADPPGWSKHQLGVAIDLHFASEAQREEFAALAIAHGMTRPHPREPWHLEITPQAKEAA